MPRHRPGNDPTERRIAELARKKLLVDAGKCVARSRALIEGSKTLIEASRQRKKELGQKGRDERR